MDLTALTGCGERGQGAATESARAWPAARLEGETATSEMCPRRRGDRAHPPPDRQEVALDCARRRHRSLKASGRERRSRRTTDRPGGGGADPRHDTRRGLRARHRDPNGPRRRLFAGGSVARRQRRVVAHDRRRRAIEAGRPRASDRGRRRPMSCRRRRIGDRTPPPFILGHAYAAQDNDFVEIAYLR